MSDNRRAGQEGRPTLGSGGPEKGPSTATYAGVGIQFAIAIVLFALLGSWLDRRFGSSPLFLILAVFLGTAAAFYSMYRKLMAVHDQQEPSSGPTPSSGQPGGRPPAPRSGDVPPPPTASGPPGAEP